jgi:nitrite reductase/ring-hydroxylating ferredoxin subunit
MLNADENELLTRVGPGTPMGNLLRQCWIPALPSSEFPAPDSPPKRMRLLGENLVMFRDTLGRMGCAVEACPHRGASLFFGRNEEAGLRCVYHGWKFDVTGQCVDMPSEPAESNFKSKVRVRAYPSRDVNHMVWVYMGPREAPPPFPEFEINTLPAENVGEPSIMMEEANWMQNLEGDLDTAHLDWVHGRISEGAPPPPVGIPGLWTKDKQPRLDVVPTDYGVYYSGKRTIDDAGNEWHRINQFIFPFHTMITGLGGAVLRSFVPLDDEWAMLITQFGTPDGPLPTEWANILSDDAFKPAGGFVKRTSDPRTYFYTAANKHNDYMRDYEVEKTSMISGIPFIGNLQDRAMTELMTGRNGEVIYDRTREHLGTTDSMVITVRRALIRAAKKLRDEGVPPPNVDDVKLDRVRHATVVLPPGVDWARLTEPHRNADSGLPIANQIALLQTEPAPPPEIRAE